MMADRHGNQVRGGDDHLVEEIEFLNNYILNELKSKDDAARQLISVNALLIGGYLAILMNSQSLGTLRDILVFMPFPEYLAYTPIIPITFWFVSIIYCLSIILPKTEYISWPDDTKSQSNYLKNILNDKCKILKYKGYGLTILGLFLIIIIMIIAIPYQLIGLSQTWNEDGIDLINQGRYDEALNAFDNAINLNRNYAEAWNNKGLTLTILNRTVEAHQAFDKAIKINPRYAEAWYNKGQLFCNQKMFAEALGVFDEAIAADSSYTRAWNSKGVVLFELDEYNKSIEVFNETIKASPSCAEAWNNKGIVLFKLGRYNESLEYFNLSAKLKPNYVDPINNLAQAKKFISTGNRASFEMHIRPGYESIILVTIIIGTLGNQTRPASILILGSQTQPVANGLTLGNQVQPAGILILGSQTQPEANGLTAGNQVQPGGILTLGSQTKPYSNVLANLTQSKKVAL